MQETVTLALERYTILVEIAAQAERVVVAVDAWRQALTMDARQAAEVESEILRELLACYTRYGASLRKE